MADAKKKSDEEAALKKKAEEEVRLRNEKLLADAKAKEKTTTKDITIFFIFAS